MTIGWSPLAIERLTEATAFAAQDNPEAAERWAAGAFELVEQLADFPESGRIVPELEREDVRELFYGAYRIIYRVSGEQEEVFILTVRHGRRQLEPSEVGGELG
jgi:toxin ParE1/3/4